MSYAGSKGTTSSFDGGGYDLDQLPASALALGNQLLQSVPNPFYSLGVIRAWHDAVIGNDDGRPVVAAIPAVYRSAGLPADRRLLDLSRPSSSTAEAFVAWCAGLLVAYTYSKLIDDSSADNSNGGTIGLHQDVYDRAADRAVSEQNIPQRFVASFVADLPFGKGKAIGSNWEHADQ